MNIDINTNIPTIEKQELAVVYARYSSHGQTEQSIEGQLSAAKAYAAAHGYSIVHEYIDRAESGRSDDRENFQRMIKDTAKKQFSVIIIWKLDRFGRNREEITINKHRCKKNGVRVESATENIPSTPEGVILESVLEGFAEYYSLQLAQNVHRGQVESAKKNRCANGQTPLGYKLDENKHYIIDPQTAPSVKLIFDMYAAGSTMPEIVRHLNSLGLRNKHGRPFQKNSLNSVLKNERYRGIFKFMDFRVEDAIPRIVDDETWFKVQEKLKENKRAPAAKWTKADYLLTDKIFCGKCGAPMIGESGTSHTGAKHNYYICSRKKHHRECDKRAVRQDLVEDIVMKNIYDILNDDELMEFLIDGTWKAYKSMDAEEEEILHLKRQLEKVNTAISNIIRAIEMGIFNEDTKARMDELVAQKKDLVSAIADKEIVRGFQLTRDHIAFFLYKLRELRTDSQEGRKRLIATFVNSVYVFDDTILLNFNYANGTRSVSLSDAKSVIASAGFVHCTLWPIIMRGVTIRCKSLPDFFFQICYSVVEMGRWENGKMGKIEGSWSGMRKFLEEETIAASLRGRVRYNCTTYVGMDGCHVFEIFVDNKVIKRFSWETVNSGFIEMGYVKKTRPMSISDYWDGYWEALKRYPMEARTEYTDEEFCRALEEYRNQSIQKSVYSKNPIVKMFALLDKRVGRRTLEKIEEDIHSQPVWVRFFYELRCNR